MFWTPNHNQATHSLQTTENKARRWGMMSIVLNTQSQPGYSPTIYDRNKTRRWGMMSIVLDTQSQPGYSQPTIDRKQGKEMGNDEYCSGHTITTRVLTSYK